MTGPAMPPIRYTPSQVALMRAVARFFGVPHPTYRTLGLRKSRAGFIWIPR